MLVHQSQPRRTQGISSDNRRIPRIEQLEDRWCPAFTHALVTGGIKFTGTNLYADSLTGIFIRNGNIYYRTGDNTGGQFTGGGEHDTGMAAPTNPIHIEIFGLDKDDTVDLSGRVAIGLGENSAFGGFTPGTILSIYFDGANGDDKFFSPPPGVVCTPLFGAPTIVFDGKSGMDTMQGHDDRELFLGGPGNDIGLGRGGDDWLLGNDDRDTLYGGSGDDIILGGLHSDIRLDGGSGLDKIYGEDGDDVIFGGSANDFLSGGPDHDEIWGDAGSSGKRG